MRFVLPLLVSALLAACATQEPQPAAKPAEMPKAEVKKAPQCWSGDDSKFFDLSQKTRISGVEVVCTATADGKNAVWMGAKH